MEIFCIYPVIIMAGDENSSYRGMAALLEGTGSQHTALRTRVVGSMDKKWASEFTKSSEPEIKPRT
jgi:hypothetical protein